MYKRVTNQVVGWHVTETGQTRLQGSKINVRRSIIGLNENRKGKKAERNKRRLYKETHVSRMVRIITKDGGWRYPLKWYININTKA